MLPHMDINLREAALAAVILTWFYYHATCISWSCLCWKL